MIGVDLFVPCLTDTFHPRSAAATVSILEFFGLHVSFPADQTCCGQAHRNCGSWDDARGLIRRMAKVFSGDRAIVTPSGSCAAMVRIHASQLFAPTDVDFAAIQSMSRRVREFSEFLCHDLRINLEDHDARWPGISSGNSAAATTHFSCHLRELGLSTETETLLSQIAGLEVRPLPDFERCCGFGGAFAVDEPELSSELGREKSGLIESTDADLWVINESGCRLQIEGTYSRSGQHRQRRVLHLSEVIAESLGIGIMGEQPMGLRE